MIPKCSHLFQSFTIAQSAPLPAPTTSLMLSSIPCFTAAQIVRPRFKARIKIDNPRMRSNLTSQFVSRVDQRVSADKSMSGSHLLRYLIWPNRCAFVGPAVSSGWAFDRSGVCDSVCKMTSSRLSGSVDIFVRFLSRHIRYVVEIQVDCYHEQGGDIDLKASTGFQQWPSISNAKVPRCSLQAGPDPTHE